MLQRFARKLVPGTTSNDEDALRAAGVPVASDPCKTCQDPCDEGHDEYSKKFEVDLESKLLGSVKPYRKQLVISTGKTDWVHEVTEEKGSLAKFIADADTEFGKEFTSEGKEKDADKADKAGVEVSTHVSIVAGLMNQASATRISIHNGSHTSNANDPDMQATVLVFPDYVAVVNVAKTPGGAEALWLHALQPNLRRAGTVGTVPGVKTYILPYNCIIMLCSHKKRDNRCHIASQKLEEDFTRWLESEAWSVDLNVCDFETNNHVELERIAESEEEREAAALEELETLSKNPEKKALIVKNSHVGGHKFAGNVIIYFPQGQGVWYGRVTPHEVPSIVKHTILKGKVLAPLLRGGLNISRPGRESLLDW